MADDRYSIPWAPPDIGPGVSMIMSAINANRADERSRAYLDMEQAAVKDRAERESAALARQKEQDQFTRDLKAMEAIPELTRRERRSPGMGNVNPFNIQFEQQADLPPDVEGPELSPAASAARYMMNPGKAGQAAAPQLDAEQAPPDVLPRGVEGPIQTPEGQAYQDVHRRGDDETAALMEEATAETPPIEDMLTKAAMNANGIAPQQKRLYMTYKGQRSEVPEQSDVMSGIPEVDAMAESILASGSAKTPQDALKIAMGYYEKNLAEEGRSHRQTTQIDFRNKDREDKQTFTAGENAKYKLTFEQRKQLTEILARAKTAAAGAGPVTPAQAAIVKAAEEGADEGTLWQMASDAHLTQKQVQGPVQSVVGNAAKRERAGQGREKLIATGPGTKPGDMWRDSQSAAKGTQQIQRFHRVEERLKELIADVEQNGERIGFDTKEYVNRMSKAKAAAAALRPYNELSSTDASMKSEEAILGPTGAFGHGWTLGADLTTLKRLLAEAQGQQQVNLQTLLRPAGHSQLAPALGGPRQGGGSDMVTIRNARTGETKQVTRDEAQAMGAL